MKKLLLIFTVFASFCFGQNKENQYKITGMLANFANNTWLYLSDISDGSYKDIDSTILQNEKFYFAGNLTDKVVKFGIHTKNFEDRVTFWIDDSETTIFAEKGNFKKALIKGSKEQQKQYELDSISENTKNKKQDYIEFIQKNPSSIVSADLLKIYGDAWGKETASDLYQKLSPDMKNSIYGKQVLDFLTFNVSPKIGDKFVDFQQENMNGENIKLSDYQGKIILLDFWGSWCAPCIAEFPNLINTYHSFKDQGFEILGIVADTDKKKLTKVIEKHGLIWQNLCDFKGDQNKVALIYGVSYYPANFLIDEHGIIIAKDLHGEDLDKKLRELLSKAHR
ncbi:MAG: AhpC/TSA family protein [Flavobacteriaceae bacterium]|jgi:peroxiredoxin|nr:AhpC/TSA family protein [Flavobacteriaceae bacterium]